MLCCSCVYPMNIQAFFDGMSAQWQRERAQSQLTLGDLIKQLSEMPTGSTVDKLENPHSYRGYYEDLAFRAGKGTMLASDLLEECRNCMGKIFEGYKGGEYMMGESTPVWVATYGYTGEKLMGVSPEGHLVTGPDEW
jgi:hypothetical protein